MEKMSLTKKPYKFRHEDSFEVGERARFLNAGVHYLVDVVSVGHDSVWVKYGLKVREVIEGDRQVGDVFEALRQKFTRSAFDWRLEGVSEE